jgi:hypothetical protein
MLLRLARHFLSRSTKFFLLLTGASAIFVYFVSPTRDPSFGKVPRPNGGSFIWWLQGVKDDHWELAAIILAGLLAISLTLDLWRWCRSQTFLAAHQHKKIILLRYFITAVMLSVIGAGMWFILTFVFV